MKSIHIRGVDEEVLERLRALARMHHRSLQGELRAILEDASKRAPDQRASEELDLVTTSVRHEGSWSREVIYGDEAR